MVSFKPIPSIKSILILTIALFFALPTSTRAEDFSFKDKYPAFAAKLDAAISGASLSGEQKSAAVSHINSWLSECKYKPIGEFLGLLDDEDARTIITSAAKNRLVSDVDIPIADDPEAYGQKTLLSLPVRGVWHIVQGNSGIVSHKRGTTEEFAWDFIIMHNGQQADGNANVNETHYCWGQPVRAPAPGVVVQVVDDLDDHLPFTINPPRHGNHVFIDNENGELSLLYHMRKGSALVKVGDRVQRGQPVGLCGDTGISMFPHLHFEVDTGTLKKNASKNVRFFGYFSLKNEPRPGEPFPPVKLRLSGIPKRLEYVMNAGDLIDVMKQAKEIKK